MKRQFILLSILIFISLAVTGQGKDSNMSFIISMEKPNTHYFQVLFKCEGIKAEALDFKLPSWAPGYYRILDYARNILDFRAEDGYGNPLSWEKITKNTWRVGSAGAETVTVKYKVFAFRISVADPFLDDGRGFIPPTGVFMHVADRIGHPVTVTIHPYHKWSEISTGLDPVADMPNTYFARDFNVLYDCPILLGNHEILSFEFQGIPHYIAIEDLGNFDRDKFVDDFRRIVETSVSIIGEIPYNHYTFIIMNIGMGGLEHLNSMAVYYNPASLDNPRSYMRWLSFIAHEYFHLYNVKRIRPIVLGPFDYDKENYTKMLWVAEGITVYYEDLILNRAGFQSRDECLEQIRRNIISHENIPGHLFQSATEASFDTWIQFFNREPDRSNRTISYYDKGSTLGLLLDLKIRHESENRWSLDDVMRKLYYEYHKEKNRGFTDNEFRNACEEFAGCPLEEIFDVYAATARKIDYPKHFEYAGLVIDTVQVVKPGAYLGASVREQNGNLLISGIEWNSPAWNGGLGSGDEILSVNGNRVNREKLDEILVTAKPGDKINFVITHRNIKREFEIILDRKVERTFTIKPVDNPDPLQVNILNDWLMEYE
ncbi:MAG: M61 family metallopeptidase [Bacteroidales bacterium]|nr:MAG: M61 family metallopeptidase [Bacteroidales bacterium]